MIELLPNDYRPLRRAFDDLRYGGFSQLSAGGPGLAHHARSVARPGGKATMHVWDYVPTTRPEGRTWDEAKKATTPSGCLTHMGRFIENVGPRQHHRLSLRQPGRHGADLVQLPARRPARDRPPHYQSGACSARRRSSGGSRCRGSTGSIWWARSSIRAAACSAPGVRPPCRCSTI